MPVFVVRPAPIYQAARGHTITLPCVAEGDPTPSVAWKKVRHSYAANIFLYGSVR